MCKHAVRDAPILCCKPNKIWEEIKLSEITKTFITLEEMEAATNRLLETAQKVGADTWQQRVKNQTPHCKFGEEGICCRICTMGPCRITPKAPRGICGCDRDGIVGRNYLRFTAGGAATHSDHGRNIAHVLYLSKDGGDYQVKDPEKLIRIAKEWGIETEGRDIYDIAHEVAETGLMEYGKPFGIQRFLKRAPEVRQKVWHDAEIEPRAIDREVSQSMHMTHMGCSVPARRHVRRLGRLHDGHRVLRRALRHPEARGHQRQPGRHGRGHGQHHRPRPRSVAV